MKKRMLSALFFVIISWAVFLIVYYFRYPINEKDTDSYVENKYGIADTRLETEGSVIYRFMDQDNNPYAVVLNRNFIFSNRFRQLEVSQKKRLTIDNRYERFDVQLLDPVKISYMKNCRAYNIKRYIWDYSLLSVSFLLLVYNTGKKRMSEQ